MDSVDAEAVLSRSDERACGQHMVRTELGVSQKNGRGRVLVTKNQGQRSWFKEQSVDIPNRVGHAEAAGTQGCNSPLTVLIKLSG